MNGIAVQQINSYLDDLASNSPTPGGGGAAALTAGQGAALLSMVIRFTIGRRKYAAHEEELQAVLERSEELRSKALQHADQDAEVFKAVASCYDMPKQTDEEKKVRKEALDHALLAAARVPMAVMQDIATLLQDALMVSEVGNRNLLTDVMVSVHLFQAAAMSCEINILINMKFASPSEQLEALLSQLKHVKPRILDLKDAVLTVCNKRLKLTS